MSTVFIIETKKVNSGGFAVIDADNVPLDATLAQALPPQHRHLYEQYDVNGTADAHARVFTNSDGNDVGSVSYIADLSAAMTSLQPKTLPMTPSMAPRAVNSSTFSPRASIS